MNLVRTPRCDRVSSSTWDLRTTPEEEIVDPAAGSAKATRGAAKESDIRSCTAVAAIPLRIDGSGITQLLVYALRVTHRAWH